MESDSEKLSTLIHNLKELQAQLREFGEKYSKDCAPYWERAKSKPYKLCAEWIGELIPYTEEQEKIPDPIKT